MAAGCHWKWFESSCVESRMTDSDNLHQMFFFKWKLWIKLLNWKVFLSNIYYSGKWISVFIYLKQTTYLQTFSLFSFLKLLWGKPPFMYRDSPEFGKGNYACALQIRVSVTQISTTVDDLILDHWVVSFIFPEVSCLYVSNSTAFQ